MIPEERAEPPAEPRRRVEAEIRRRAARGEPVGVLAIEAEVFGPARDRVAGAALAAAVLGALEQLSGRALDAFADGARLVVLLPADAATRGAAATPRASGGGPGLPEPEASVTRLCDALVRAAKRLAVPGADEPVPATLSIGIALDQPGRALEPEVLLEVAREGAAVARHRGGGRAVHTMLYDLAERRLARLRRERAPELEERATAPERTAREFAIGRAEREIVLGRDERDVAPERMARALPRGRTEASAVVPRAGAGERAALGASDAGADEHDAPASASPARAEAERLLREALERALAGAGLPELAAAERRASAAAALAAHALALAGDGALDAPRGESASDLEEELGRLRRRLAKVTAALEDAERRLAAAASAATEDLGLPSAYRGVQGLDASDALYAPKAAMLHDLLVANLALLRARRERASGAERLPA